MSTHNPQIDSDKLDLKVLSNKKNQKIKSVVVTAYDYPSAKQFSLTSVDALLVGDSVAMTVHGFKDTTHATLEMMCVHTAAVSRGAANKLIITDMPFLTCHRGPHYAVECAGALVRAGAHAVKVEGALGVEGSIEAIVRAGIPVMGHLGLTPQSYLQMGGYKVQGREVSAANKIIDQANDLQQLGIFSLVLECVPVALAQEISGCLKIPVIGIGAGPHTDGQVLVYHDLLGLIPNAPALKFTRRYLPGSELIQNAIEKFCQDVRGSDFPSENEVFV